MGDHRLQLFDREVTAGAPRLEPIHQLNVSLVQSGEHGRYVLGVDPDPFASGQQYAGPEKWRGLKRGVSDAVVGGETDDVYRGDPPGAQKIREVAGLSVIVEKCAVRIDRLIHAFPPDHIDTIPDESGMEFRPAGKLHAVNGPGAKRTVIFRMHVLRGDNHRVVTRGDPLVYRRENMRRVGDGQRPSFHEVVLDIDDEQRSGVFWRGRLHKK